MTDSNAGGPLVSIALPVYNGERFLLAAICSLLDQTYRNIELIIGDNGSTDSTQQICESVAAGDSRVRYLRSPENRGAAWNYNRLFPEATGKYFKWAAHDDLYEPTWLERCVAALEADDGLVLAYTRTIEVDSDGNELERYRPLPYANGERPSRRAHEVLSKRSRCFEAFGVGPREAFEGTGLIGPYTSSDRTLILEMALRGRFYEVPEYLFLHREHPGRSMRAFPDARARRAWFEPGAGDKRAFPFWRLFAEYVKAAGRAPLGLVEKVRTLGCIGLWGLHNRGQLFDDASQGFRGRPQQPDAYAAGQSSKALSR
jgi:glycosyltransferase involved in cell wall biosynthesis